MDLHSNYYYRNDSSCVVLYFDIYSFIAIECFDVVQGTVTKFFANW